ncbi:MAG: lysine--tRNA ligase, partial [Nanoarchaeota archaeon]|nr:lysine--tRNA ligase [Nanoarchaeota archaeon]
MADKFFWADAIADDIIKQKGDKSEYVLASGITPSGKIHIGNFREVITTDMVVLALKDKGKKVRFIYSWDDFDRFRKVPKGVDESYAQYIGKPVSEIPSPFDSSVSYARYFEREFEESLKIVGIFPEFIYQNEMNKKNAYSELIKVAIDNNSKIREILNKYRKEPLDESWYPVMIYCSKCGKDSTSISKVEKFMITYSCKCGNTETVDFRKFAGISIRWRVDWPLRWKYEEVDFEPGGIDHSVKGGSFTTAKEISKEVFDFEPPIYQFYDWISIKGGGAFSSSEGNATTLAEVGEIYEPEVLRNLFVSTKPKSAFQISFDNDVIKAYEDFDRLEAEYFNEKLNPKRKREYEMSVLEVPKEKPMRIGFRHLSTLVQIGEVEGLNEYDVKRADKVRNWLSKYAPIDMKFVVRGKVEEKLKGKNLEALLELRKILKDKNYETDENLFNE